MCATSIESERMHRRARMCAAESLHYTSERVCDAMAREGQTHLVFDQVSVHKSPGLASDCHCRNQEKAHRKAHRNHWIMRAGGSSHARWPHTVYVRRATERVPMKGILVCVDIFVTGCANGNKKIGGQNRLLVFTIFDDPNIGYFGRNRVLAVVKSWLVKNRVPK